MSESPGASDDAHADPDTTMRTMMGFSSFSERRPKNQPHTPLMNAGPIVTDPQGTMPGVQGLSNLSASNPPGVFDSTKLSGGEQHLSTPPQPSSSSIPVSTQPKTTYVFTSPQTGIMYTSEELDEWSRGKTNERGDKVFFKPGFVSDDPWFRLRNAGKGGERPGDHGGKGNGS